jgi:hypothetical protein
MVESIWWGQAALAATHERAGRGKVHDAGLRSARVQLAAGLGAALGLGRDGPQARGALVEGVGQAWWWAAGEDAAGPRGYAG